MELAPVIFFLAIAAVIVYLIVKKSGIGLMFGGKIVKTIDGNLKGKRKILTQKLDVHVVDLGAGIKQIGIGVKHYSALSYQMVPITLSVDETRSFISMLNEACDYDISHKDNV